ncbi:MAG: ADP-forming succinate--CoA ligase subunit beta [Bacteroidales bacterium]|nr:ADP-forming succinate--CoA ligase subunit beta [Bacteroidales bacterium]
MNLHEYQAKQLLQLHGVPVAEGLMVETPEAAVEAARLIELQTGTKFWVIKAQIHAGGRGKGGGVKIASSLAQVEEHASNILGMNLVTPQTGPEGKLVRKLLVQRDMYYPDAEGNSSIREYYISILLKRKTGRNIVMYSNEGGVDIESVAKNTPELIFIEEIDPGLGIQPFQARKIAFNLKLRGEAHSSMVRFVMALYKAYVEMDASLVEINPLVKTSDNLAFAADAKVKLDENALFRHPDYAGLRDLEEEDPVEVEASGYNLNFIKLDGNVGCMVNGAGLAMATMDMIKLSGGQPANFLDVGGVASTETVGAGIRIILRDPNVQAILINIFGGIVRCDRVAQGVVDACREIGNIPVPIIVRLQGTNAAEGKNIIDLSGLKVSTAITLEEAAAMVKEAVS